MNKFEKKLFAEFKKILIRDSRNKKTMDALGLSLGRDLFGNDYQKGKKIDQIPPATEKEKTFIKIFKAYFETKQSLDYLGMTAIFVNHYPNYRSSAKRNINKFLYLHYHIGSYLNELYIFQQRIDKLFNILIKNPRLKKLRTEVIRVKKLKSHYISAFKNIDKLRGLHVHDKRYYDKDFTRLELLESYTKGSTRDKLTSILKAYKDVEYNNIRSKWKRTIKHNNEEFIKLLDQLSKSIYPIVFNKILI